MVFRKAGARGLVRGAWFGFVWILAWFGLVCVCYSWFGFVLFMAQSLSVATFFFVMS